MSLLSLDEQLVKEGLISSLGSLNKKQLAYIVRYLGYNPQLFKKKKELIKFIVEQIDNDKSKIDEVWSIIHKLMRGGTLSYYMQSISASVNTFELLYDYIEGNRATIDYDRGIVSKEGFDHSERDTEKRIIRTFFVYQGHFKKIFSTPTGRIILINNPIPIFVETTINLGTNLVFFNTNDYISFVKAMTFLNKSVKDLVSFNRFKYMDLIETNSFKEINESFNGIAQELHQISPHQFNADMVSIKLSPEKTQQVKLDAASYKGVPEANILENKPVKEFLKKYGGYIVRLYGSIGYQGLLIRYTVGISTGRNIRSGAIKIRVAAKLEDPISGENIIRDCFERIRNIAFKYLA